jgi:hypothetical protein
MCVQSSSVLHVLQFTPFNVVCYVLHRSVSQVIHGQQLSSLETIASVKSMAVTGVAEASRLDFSVVRSNNPFNSSSVRLLVGFNTNITSLHTMGTGRLIYQPSQRLTKVNHTTNIGIYFSGNDPSAGSPTDTLLRLLLPLNNQVWRSLVSLKTLRPPCLPPKASLNHSIGSSDGRCVQRAGT